MAKVAPSRFQDLSIAGFRKLKSVKLALRPLSVMIGGNGSGKTSILEVLSLLANSAQGRLSESIADLSGLQSILTYGGTDALRLGSIHDGKESGPAQLRTEH